MRRLRIAVAVAASLVTAGVAGAGGWATAGLAPPPDEISAGDTWNAQVTILQHGRTPLSGVEPTVTIRNEKTGEAKTFPAKPTKKTGVYEAHVVFPAGGTWTYEVWDGFTQTHTFGEVVIGGDSGGSSFSPPSLWPLLAAAAVAATALAFAAYRRRPKAPVAAG